MLGYPEQEREEEWKRYERKGKVKENRQNKVMLVYKEQEEKDEWKRQGRKVEEDYEEVKR